MIQIARPPASLAGHTGGKGSHWRAKAAVTAKHRELARLATLAANVPPVPVSGDIRLVITFYPPNRRGDRTNYLSRLKPAIDGIAEALGVNDRRFVPSLLFCEPVKDARVVVMIEAM